MNNSRKPIILSSPRILTCGRILISVLTVFVLTVFVNAQDTVFRYPYGSSTSNASGTDITTVQKTEGAALGDVLKLSGDATQNGRLNLESNNGAYLNFTIQSDTPGTMRTIKKTAGSDRFYNFNTTSGTNASMTLKDLSIQGSDSEITDAIGLFFHSSTSSTTVNLTVDNVTFSGFKNSGHNGGVIAMDNAGTLTITGSGTGKIEFNNNYAKTYGGAIHGAETTITGNVVKFTNNSANEQHGGAIYIYNDTQGMLTITGNGDNPTIEFSGNTAGNNGGAIYSAKSVTFSGNNTSAVFTGNTAATGNDIYINGASGLSFTGSGIYSFDGGIYLNNTGATTVIDKAQVTIAGRANDTTNNYQLRNVTISNGGKLTANMDQINSLTGTFNLGTAGSEGALELNVTAGAQTFANVISGAGGLTKIGAGTLELTAANTFTGKTTVSGGTLKLSGSGAKLASTTIDVAAGTTLLYDNTFPHNTSPLTINVTNGTLEFYNTTISNTHTNNGICSGKDGQGVTINGTGATLLIDGGGTVSAIDGTGKSTITFALDSNSVFHVKNGYFINGGYATQNWDNNKAELRIGATSTVNLWDGALMKVGGLTGEAGAKILNTSDNGKGLSIGNGTTSSQTFVYNGTIDLRNRKTLTKTGDGTQVLNGAISNTIVNSNSGTLVLGTAGNEMKIGSSSAIKTNGGAIRVDGNLAVDTSYFSAGGSWTGNGSIKVNSNGVFRVGGTFNFAKGITLNGGLLFNDGDNGGRNAIINAPITVAANSNVQCGWNASDNPGSLTLSGGLYGSGNLTVNTDSSAGWISITGTGSYTGSLTISGKGKIRIGGEGKNIGTSSEPASATPYIGSKEIRFEGGTLHNFDAYLTFSNDLNFVSESSLQAGWNKDMTFTGALTGSGKLKVPSDGGWVIMGTSSDGSFTGIVQTSWDSSSKMGKMRLAANQPFGSNVGAGYFYGQLDMNSYSQVFKGLYSNVDGSTKKGQIFNNSNTTSTLTLDITGIDLTYQGKITGNIEMEINSTGTGTQTFANNGSSFTGNVVINGGTVSATAGHASYTTTALGAFSTPGGRTITVNSGAELALGTNDVLGGCDPGNYNANAVRLIINGGKLSGSNNNALYNATFQNGAEVYGNNNRPTWQSFWLIGTNYISFAGDGESPEQPVQFNGASGVVFVLYESPVLNVADITLSDESDLVVNVIFGNKSSDPVSNNSLTKTGAGTMEFTKANAYTGGTTISDGVLKFTDAAVVANGPITVENNGTLEYNLSSGQTKKLTITNASKIFSTGKVVKTGDGTLQICTESAGLVDASSFVVSSGRLDMKEYFKGSLAVEAGATLSPGNSVGTLTVDGTFSLDSGATLLMEVGKNDQGEIVVDQLILSEVDVDKTFAQGSIINIVLDPTSGLVGGDSFTDLVFITTTSDADAASIFDAVKNATFSYYFPGFEVKLDGNNILLSGTLSSNAVPEPSTWALLVLGVAGLMYWRRRK